MVKGQINSYKFKVYSLVAFTPGFLSVGTIYNFTKWSDSTMDRTFALQADNLLWVSSPAYHMVPDLVRNIS